MDAATLIILCKAHAWLPLSAFGIGLVVRLLKSDTVLPINIPPKYRLWLALGLGVVAGVLDKAAQGIDWPTAIVGGLVAGGMAVIGHDGIVESLRGGKEIPMPASLMVKDPPGGSDPPGMG